MSDSNPSLDELRELAKTITIVPGTIVFYHLAENKWYPAIVDRIHPLGDKDILPDLGMTIFASDYQGAYPYAKVKFGTSKGQYFTSHPDYRTKPEQKPEQKPEEKTDTEATKAVSEKDASRPAKSGSNAGSAKGA